MGRDIRAAAYHPLTCSVQVLALLDGPLEELVALATCKPGQFSAQADCAKCDVSTRSDRVSILNALYLISMIAEAFMHQLPAL